MDTEIDHDNLLAEIESLRLRVAELEDIQVRLASMEQALRYAEERFRLLYENAPLGYQSLDDEGRIVDVNPAWLEALGYSPEEVIGHWFGDFLAPGYQEHFKADFQKSIAAGEIHWTDFDMIRKDGSTFSMALDGQIGGDHCGRAYGITAVRMHVELDRAEDELRHSEERYRTLVEESFDGILVQKGSKIVFGNSRLYEMLGYNKGELDGLDHWLVYHPDYQEITRERALSRMRGEELPSHYEVRLQRKDGTSFEGEIRARVVSFKGESGVQVWIRDISERKQTEKRLGDSERKYRELVELANSIILRWTCDGRITFLNDFGQKFFGYSAEEILGRHVVGTIVPIADSSGRDLGPLMDQILADPKAFERNINENMRRNGERVWVSWTNRIVMGEPGHVAEVLSIGTDITERKKAQEELQQAHDKLEHRVAERTAELAQAKERAEAADRLKSAFLATMSHELRTPLNSIIGFTGIILQGLAGPLNPEQSKQLEMVRSSSRHLLALINDVLDISKIEAGQLEVASEPFDLHASITKVIGIVAPLAEKKGLSLRGQIAPGLGEAVGDQRRVEQILFNLLNNAIKFTGSGEVELTAELVSDFGTSGGRSRQPAIRLYVSDTGIGIKAEDLETLFQPFRQIESGLTRSHDGTGLGLAICRRLADLMGGEIHAESVWEKGSTFTLTLPLNPRNR
jgi:PAS domain S-box-containing protein